MNLVVTRTGGTGLATVNYTTPSGTDPGGALSGTDFADTPGMVTFNPGGSPIVASHGPGKSTGTEGGHLADLPDLGRGPWPRT